MLKMLLDKTTYDLLYLNRVDVDSQSKGLDRIKHDDDAYTFGRRI